MEQKNGKNGGNGHDCGFLGSPVEEKRCSKEEPRKKTRYSKEELEEFKAVIDEKLLKTKEQLVFYSEIIMEIKDKKFYSKDDHDGAKAEQLEENSLIAERLEKFIANLEKAVFKIGNGTYGVCEETGDLIQKQRLLASPCATCTIEAKNIKNGKKVFEPL